MMTVNVSLEKRLDNMRLKMAWQGTVVFQNQLYRQGLLDNKYHGIGAPEILSVGEASKIQS